MRVYGDAVMGSRKVLVDGSRLVGEDGWVWLRPIGGDKYLADCPRGEWLVIEAKDIKTWRGNEGQLLESCPIDFRLASDPRFGGVAGQQRRLVG